MARASLVPVCAFIAVAIIALTAGYQLSLIHPWAPTIIAVPVPVVCFTPSLVLFGMLFTAFWPESSTVKPTYATSVLSGGALTGKLISGDTKYY
jgi:hypothetical protein